MTQATQNLPSWNLGDLYTGALDPKIQKDLEGLLRSVEDFRKANRGNLSSLNASELADTLETLSAMYEQFARIHIFASLLESQDLRNEEANQLVQQVGQAGTKLSTQLAFFNVELAQMGAHRLEELANYSSDLKSYRNFLLQTARVAPYILSENEEQLATILNADGRSSLVDLFEKEGARSEFRFRRGSHGEIEVISQNKILGFLHEPDRSLRRNASNVITRNLEKRLWRQAFLYNRLVAGRRKEREYRGWESMEEPRHVDNQLTQAQVSALTEAVTSRYDIVQRYYRLKGSHMGLGQLYDYDRYAPLVTEQETIPYSEARGTILDSFGRFSPNFQKIAQEFFDNDWIDAEPRRGKQTGAFCSLGTPDTHPWVLLSYEGLPRNVATLAHELGHGIHAYLARKNPHLEFYPGLALAETASVLGETITMDALKRSANSNEERIALLASEIEDHFATVSRQTSMYRFEQLVWARHAEKDWLKEEDFNRLWRETQVEMFGDSVVLRPEYDVWWSYIPHFQHTPFYVYAYAFGQLLSLALYAKYEAGEISAEDIISILEAGGSKTPDELVTPLGIDLADPNFWHAGLDIIESRVDEFENLVS